MKGISSRARAYIRSHAEVNMTYTCVVERPGVPTADDFNEETSTYNDVAGLELYTGPCRIYELSGSGVIDVNFDHVVTQQTKLSIPWDEGVGIRRDDEVKIVSATHDAALVGKRFRILDVDKGGDLRATRRFTIQGIQED